MKCKAFLFAVIFAACNDNSGIKTGTKTQDTYNAGSVALTSSTFDEKLFKAISLPLNIDTTFILRADTNDRIPYQQIRSLGSEFLKHEFTESLAGHIEEFCKIDSLKQAGTYKTYVDSLTIGMTKKSIAYKVGVVDFRNNAKLFIWGITASSYEACPFFAGTYLVGTFVNEAGKNTHFVIGEISGGGDPPSMGSNKITAKISPDGKIEITGIRILDDMDAPGEETTKQNLEIKVDKDKLELKILKTEIKNTEAIEKT